MRIICLRSCHKLVSTNEENGKASFVELMTTHQHSQSGLMDTPAVCNRRIEITITLKTQAIHSNGLGLI